MVDLPTAATRYFPKSPTVIAVTSTSTTFTAVNTSAFEMYCTVVATTDCYVKVGDSSIGAATSADFLVQTGTHDYVLRPGEGVRVIRVTADGTLQIGVNR